MPNKIIKTYKKEMKMSNCGFNHDPAEVIVRSQWQARSKSNYYLAYRWIVAIFTTAVVIESLYVNTRHYPLSLFFIYLTHWGILMNMIVGISGALLVTVWHFNSDFKDKIVKTSEMPTAFKVYWALHNIALITSFVVTIIYWSILHKPSMPVNATNILSHAMNSVIMFVDILIIAYPLRLYHVIQPICYGMVYGLFSFIYYLCGGVNIAGKPYIYNVLDWSQPKKAMVTTVGTLVLAIIVHFVLFMIYKMRVFVQRRFCRPTDLILPTISQNRRSTLTDTRISMVFGGDPKGITNEAFTNSTDKVSSS